MGRLGGGEPITEPKILNAISKYIEQIAEARGRNGTLARMLVTENLNLGPEEALKSGLIDIIATSIKDLLNMLDGKTLTIRNIKYIFNTRDAYIEWYEPGFKYILISIFSHPLIVTILFIAGLYGLIFGLAYSEPTSAIIGGLLVILSLIGMGFNVNLIAMILIAIGIILLVAEALVIPGFGVAGIVGALMLVLGGLLLPISIDPSRWIIHVEWYNKLLFISMAAVIPLAIFSLIVVYKIVRIRKKPVLYYTNMVGERGIAIDELGPDKEGFILCHGEYWKATSNENIKPGDPVIVVKREGFKLIVKKIEIKK